MAVFKETDAAAIAAQLAINAIQLETSKAQKRIPARFVFLEGKAVYIRYLRV